MTNTIKLPPRTWTTNIGRFCGYGSKPRPCAREYTSISTLLSSEILVARDIDLSFVLDILDTLSKVEGVSELQAKPTKMKLFPQQHYLNYICAGFDNLQNMWMRPSRSGAYITGKYMGSTNSISEALRKVDMHFHSARISSGLQYLHDEIFFYACVYNEHDHYCGALRKVLPLELKLTSRQ